MSCAQREARTGHWAEMHLELAVGVALPLLAPKRLRHVIEEEVAVALITLQVEAAGIERLELQR